MGHASSKVAVLGALVGSLVLLQGAFNGTTANVTSSPNGSHVASWTAQSLMHHPPEGGITFAGKTPSPKIARPLPTLPTDALVRRTKSLNEDDAGRPAHEDFEWMLPPGARGLFCTSIGEDMRDPAAPDHLDGYVVNASNFTFSECDEPVVVHHYPPGFGTATLQVLSRAVVLTSRESGHTAAGEVLERGDRQTRLYQTIKHCVRECLRSPYCRGFQGPVFGQTCLLLSSSIDAAAGGQMPANNLHVTLLAFERVFRPSLIVSHTRLVGVRGPAEIIHLNTSTLPLGYCTTCSWEVVVRPFLPRRTLAAARVRIILLEGDDSEAENIANIQRVEGNFSAGITRFYFDLRHIPFGQIVGRRLRLIVEPVIEDGQDSGLMSTPTRWEHDYLVQLEATGMALVTTSNGGLTVHGGADSQLSISNNCAPLINPLEVCVTNIALRHVVSTNGASIVGNASMTKSRAGHVISVELNDVCFRIVDGESTVLRTDGGADLRHLILSVKNEASSASCSDPNRNVTFFARHFEEPMLVVRAGPLAAFFQSRMGAAVPKYSIPRSGTSVGYDRRVSSLPILLSTTAFECQRCVEQQMENIYAFAPRSIVVLRLGGMFTIFHVAQFNNTLAHPRVYAHAIRYGRLGGNFLAHLHALNIHYMSKAFPHVHYSHVVVLSSNEMFVRRGLEDYVQRFDMSRGTAIPKSAGHLVRHTFPTRQFSRAFGTDDEMELIGTTFEETWGRPPGGMQNEFHVAAVMRKYNITKWPREQIFFEGSFFCARVARVFMRLMLDDFGAVRIPGLRDQPVSLHHSGSTKSRSTFRPVHPFPTSEIIPYLFLHILCKDDNPLHREANVAWLALFNEPNQTDELLRPNSLNCGDHVSTVTWRSPHWTVSVHDIFAVRCSPFAVPMAMKRVPRIEDHPIRRYIVSLQQNSTLAARLRDDQCGDELQNY